MSNILLVNITWNPHKWRKPYFDKRAGHLFAKDEEGGESLNFNFRKNRIDTNEHVHGFFKWTRAPVRFEEGGLIIFYTCNLDEGKKGQLVGIYGNTSLRGDLDEPFVEHYTLRASKRLSMLFPISLDEVDYKIPGQTGSKSRLVPQCGYTYKSMDFAAQVLKDEIDALQKVGNYAAEVNQLQQVYEYYIGEQVPSINTDDEREQLEILKRFGRKSKAELLAELRKVRPGDPEIVEINRKIYRRDNKTVALIKLVRGQVCQLCGWSMQREDGSAYIEAAHIEPKASKGGETLDNLLLLCPNHHKEFDLGSRSVFIHTSQFICFALNGKEYTLSFDGSEPVALPLKIRKNKMSKRP